MLTKITKRNGTVVDFSPEKLNLWAEWASVVGVDWSSIVLSAVRKCTDGCSSVDLHKAMIDACLDEETSAHLKMAGRLYIGDVYKEAFGGCSKIPTVKQQFEKMQQLGFMEKLDYTAEEYAFVNSIINHKLDLEATYTELFQIRSKYSIVDRVKNICYESPQFVYMRMAMANMEKMPKERRMEDVAKLYAYLSHKQINAPTPFMVNLGTKMKGYASCCVFTTDDTMHSISAGNHISEVMTANSAGIGGFIKCRSKGDSVRGGTVKHGGKLPYYRASEAAVHANKQNSRGGASTLHFNCLDPEIIDLLALKNPTTVDQKRIKDIDYSFGYNEFFARKVARNEDWMLVSYLDAPELVEALYQGNSGVFEVLYNEYWASDKPRVTVNARDVAIKALTEAVETGRIYLHRTDEMNKHTPFKDKIYSSNLCVSPETKILTRSGYISISELQGLSVEVWNGKEWSDVTVVKTGINQKLLRVITKGGFEVDCTPYHKFYLSNGKQVAASELKVGDKLIKFDLPVIEGVQDLKHAYANGFYSGDGCLVGDKQRLYFYGEKKNLISRCGDIFIDNIDQPNQDRVYRHTYQLEEKFFVPSSYYTIKSRMEWFAGVLDSDGTVVRNGKTQGLQLGSVNKEFLQEIQLMLQTCGVNSKVTKNQEAGMRLLPANDGSGENKLFSCQNAYRLLIGNTGLNMLQKLGIQLSRLVLTDHKPNRECSHFIKVAEIRDEGRFDDTFCFTEPKRHMGMFNGLLTGQCQEIALPTRGYPSVKELYEASYTGEIGLCSLASIVCGRVGEQEYEDVAYYTLLMIDNVLDIMEYPFPNLEYTASKRRSVGVGLTNLAFDMANRGFSYRSSHGKRYMHTVAERHSYYLHKASLRLAKERGAAEWIGKTKYPEGWLPIDTYCKNVDDVVSSSKLKYDWEVLRKDIIDQGGIRHSVLEAYMPVESSSLATYTTNSIYPVRTLKVLKTNGNSKTLFIAPDAENLAHQYESAWDVPTEDLIDMYAIFQKFTGQGISADLYLKYEGDNRKVSTKKLLTDFLYMTKMGLKSRYYLNSGAGVKFNTEQVEDKGCGSGGCTL